MRKKPSTLRQDTVLQTKTTMLSPTMQKGVRGGVFSYEQEYPNATKELDLSLEKLPNFVLKRQQKLLQFSLQGKSYSIPFAYNKNLIDFMATYPQADYETFFNTPLEKSTLSDLSIAFKEHISGKKSEVKLSILCSILCRMPLSISKTMSSFHGKK